MPTHAEKASTATKPASKTTKARGGARSTRKTARAAAKPEDAIKILKDDHKEVRGWFDEFDKTDDEGKKEALARSICHALTIHTQVEEEFFYPAAREADVDHDLLDEAAVEHASAKQLIGQIENMSPSDPMFDATVTVLGEYVKHHVQEEETQLFPECRESDMDIRAVGAKIAARKAELTQ